MALLRDVVHYANEADLPLAILSLDQEKTFDRVDWPFLQSTRLRTGFGQSFVKWVALFYTDIRSSISSMDTLRATLNHLGAQDRVAPCLHSFMAHPAIKGLMFPRAPAPLLVLSLCADDTSVISSSDAATAAVFDTNALFEAGSGAK